MNGRPLAWIRSLTLVLALTGPAAADDLPPSIAAALSANRLSPAAVAMLVQDLDAATPSLAHGVTRPFSPASAMKLVTSLAALDRFGPAHVWQTRVWRRGVLRDGVLAGDLILEGGGDPALTRERFSALLRAVRAQGIAHIQGDVILDDRLYALDAIDPGAFDDAPLRPYNAPPAALLVDFNLLDLHVRPGPDGIEARLDPPALLLDNRLQLDPGGACGGNGIEARREGDVLRLDGRVAAACGAQTRPLNLLCPPANVAAHFRQAWAELGGRHDGQIRLGTLPADAVAVLAFDSPPLAGLVRDVNKHSNNVMAKMLFLNLGLARFGAPATWAKAEAALRDWLLDSGLDLPELVLENGSGLSRKERLTTGGLAALLRWAASRPLYYEFAASLPALGQEGTQRRNGNGEAAAGRAWLKSGSLNGVRAQAGYLMDAGGRRKVVVFLYNAPDTAAANAVFAALIDWAMRRSPPADAVF